MHGVPVAFAVMDDGELHVDQVRGRRGRRGEGRGGREERVKAFEDFVVDLRGGRGRGGGGGGVGVGVGGGGGRGGGGGVIGWR